MLGTSALEMSDSETAGPEAVGLETSLKFVLRAKLDRLGGARPNLNTTEIEHWLEMLEQEDHACALAVVDRLDQVLEKLDAGGFARWIINAQRLYPRDLVRQQRYFSLKDSKAVEALHGEASAVDLAAAMAMLGHLMAGFSGKPVTLQVLSQKILHALPARPILNSTHLLLPDSYTIADSAHRFNLFRAAVAHAAAHLRFSRPGLPVTTLKPMSVAVVSAVEDARVEQLLVDEMPGIRGWFIEAQGWAPEKNDLSFPAHIARLSRALMDDQYIDESFWVEKARTLFEQVRQSHGLEDYEAYRRIASILANDLGQMRVPFNPQMYCVPAPYRDDNSYLWDFGESKGKPPEGHELQVQPPPQSASPARKTDQPPDPSELQETRDEIVTVFRLPEWDYRSQHYRQEWCTLYERTPPASSTGNGRSVQSETSKRPHLALPITRRLSRTRRLRRQLEGEDIDLNAAVDVMVSRRLDLAPEPRLFMRPGRAEPSSSVILLLDLSESANDLVPNREQTVLDIEKEAALSLAAAIVSAKDKLAIHGFCSDTRSRVNYIRLVNANEPLDEMSVGIVRETKAAFSTRMGAAIRHATNILMDDPADQRAVIVITDGSPSDVDVYDEKYLIEDAHDAVNSATRHSVQCLCLALDKNADDYVRNIFGWRNYQIIDNPDLMTKRLRSLYGRFLML